MKNSKSQNKMIPFVRNWFLITLVWFCAPGAQIPSFYSVDTTGSSALIESRFQAALTELTRGNPGKDTAFWNFKKGLAAYNLKDYGTALSCFRKCIAAPFCLSSLVYEYTGDIEGEKKHPREALDAYLYAIKDTLSHSQRTRIGKKMSALIAKNPKLTDTIPFLSQWLVDTIKAKKEVLVSIEKFPEMDSLGRCLNAQCIDSMVMGLWDSAHTSRQALLLDKFEDHTLPDSLISTRLMFRASQIEFQSKAYTKSWLWLTKAIGRHDFKNAVLPKTALYHRSLTAYYTGRYDSAVALLGRYTSQYGVLPEVVMALARSYRNTNQMDLAMQTYKTLLKRFPRDPLAYDVLWYLAWDNEENGNYSKAIELYRKIGIMRKNGKHAEDWEYRIGLCYYKEEYYKQAYSQFSQYAAKHPDASQFYGALYWKAKSRSSSLDTSGAGALLLEVIRLAPMDYYAFRAREAIALFAATASLPPFDTTSDWVAARTWLDSIATPSKEKISCADSSAFERGVRLVFAGLGSLARDYFEPLESEYPANLQFQFDLAILYKIANDPTASYRLGRKLLWRIPQEHRVKTPLPIIEIGYPFAFFDAVKRAAASDTIDAFLILAVMRQESVFNPSIVSRAGAIGLMQLMPATAKSVAHELSETFFQDSLTRFATNIRFGSHYLKKLLDQFGGNMVLTLAAYNGGPPAVLKWLEKNKTKTFDLFVEGIGYEETRGYVKKVLANYWMYKKLSRSMR